MSRLFLKRSSTAILSCAGLLFSVSCASSSPPGEVMLLVSTNLSIPNDADSLHVTVTRSGESAPFLDQSYALGDGATVHLPGSVALVSAEKSRGFVQVHLELQQSTLGASKKAVRVQRDAELEIPSVGVKQLPMALDFLCAEGSPPTPCPAGQTCDVGQCIDDKIIDPSQLSEYVSSPPAACFDVQSCFGSINVGNITVPQQDGSQNLGCSVKSQQVGNAQDVNVALVVNTAAVGNYGVCDASSGRCLVPLDQGPNGWHTLTDGSQGAIAIGFPDAVCAAVGKSIAGVAIIPASASCPSKSAASTLCPASAACVAADGIGCPADWAGYSCSAGICPPSWSSPYCAGEAIANSDYCGAVGRDPKAGPLVSGLWCCGPTEPPPNEPPLLIDDMSSGPFIKLEPKPGESAGAWFSACDDINAEISPPQAPALFTFRTIEPPVKPMAGVTISHAACLSSDDGFEGYAALEGFTFFGTPPDYGPLPFDLTPYTGISFWAYAEPGKIVDETGAPLVPTEVQVQFPDVNTFTERADSTCVKSPAGRTSCDQFGKFVTLTKDWTRYFVRWDELTQVGFGTPFPNFSKREVYQTGFFIKGPGKGSRSLPFDFCVAQIEFTTDSSTPQLNGP